MELVIEFFWFCVQLALWGFFWHFVLGFWSGYIGKDIKQREQVIAHLNKVIHAVKVEKHGDIMYWFDATNDQFIAQGRTMEEIVTVLKDRWSKHIFLLEEKQMLAGPEFKAVPISEEAISSVTTFKNSQGQ